MTENPAQSGKEYELNTRAGHLVGNYKPGDGPKYIGRGLLYLTDYDNYKKFGREFKEDLINHPDRVAKEYSLAVRTACAFWQSKGLNALADLDDFVNITYRVNGGFNGRPRREKALKAIKIALHM